MKLSKLIDRVKEHPNFNQAGMILCHNGIVRSTSRDGRKVSGLKITVDHETLGQVIESHKKMPGIVDVQVEIEENRTLNVGDDVMFLVVAGDIREHVIAALSATLNAVKSTVTKKTEYFV
ncbi:MAG: molybdenum cofactor biosynthesis protein MoaE [Deltaproteobacteria bacterium]|nr:molybdenum cofactor biosynthesis protein MoaE [Deltaproteobacteria bacterium]